MGVATKSSDTCYWYNRQHVLRPLPLVFDRAILIDTATSGWPGTKVSRVGEEGVVVIVNEKGKGSQKQKVPTGS